MSAPPLTPTTAPPTAPAKSPGSQGSPSAPPAGTAVPTPAAPQDLGRALHAAAGNCRSKPEFLRQALRLLAAHFQTVYAAMNVEGAGGVQRDSVPRDTNVERQWHSISQALLLDVRFRNASRARYLQAAGNRTFAAIALPLADPVQGTFGTLLAIIPCETSQRGGALLAELNAWTALVGMLSAQLSSAAKPAASAGPAPTAAAAATAAAASGLRGVEKAATFDDLNHFAFSIVNGLKSKFGCDQVALGRVRGHNVRVLCVSDTSEVYTRSPGVRQIQQAMTECLDADTTVVYQRTPQHAKESSHARLLVHKHWHEAIGHAAVVSIPLKHRGETVAILSLRGAEQQTFSDEDIKKIEELAGPLTPGIVMLDRAGRSVARHVLDNFGLHAARARHSRVRRLVALILITAAAWLILGRVEYVVTAPCEMVADQQRHITAPFEGAISAVYVKPGDEVVAGQVLCELDTAQLLLDQQRYQSEFEMASLQVARAVSEQQTAMAGELQAQADIARVQLDLVEKRLQQARITAPCDGVIIDGDLQPRLGEVVPLGEPLANLAPQSALAVEVQIPEYAATMLAQGQCGSLALSARPDQSFQLVVDSVRPMSSVRGGQNVFVARANLVGRPAWTRAGMTGVAQVETGRRPAWWALLHRVFDQLRIWMWRL